MCGCRHVFNIIKNDHELQECISLSILHAAAYDNESFLNILLADSLKYIFVILILLLSNDKFFQLILQKSIHKIISNFCFRSGNMPPGIPPPGFDPNFAPPQFNGPPPPGSGPPAQWDNK